MTRSDALSFYRDDDDVIGINSAHTSGAGVSRSPTSSTSGAEAAAVRDLADGFDVSEQAMDYRLINLGMRRQIDRHEPIPLVRAIRDQLLPHALGCVIHTQ
jgi:hypothetical protein